MPVPVRVGVIGRGYGERYVAPAFAATEGCEVVEVVSPRDHEAVAALCARADVDLVSVHSPPFLHLDHVTRALDAGHAVLCDKPFGRHAGDARRMNALADEAATVALLNFETRFDPPRAELRRLVAEGSVGEPAYVRVTQLMGVSRSPLRPYGWLFDADLGGGWLRSIGSHQIDFVRWVFGEISGGSALLRTAIRERPDAAGVLRDCSADDGFTAHVHTASGVDAVIDSTSSGGANLTPVVQVVGSDAVLELVAEQRIVRHTATGSEEVFACEAGDPLARSMRAYTAAVLEAVRSGGPGPHVATFADGLACVEVMDGLIEGGVGRA